MCCVLFEPQLGGLLLGENEKMKERIGELRAAVAQHCYALGNVHVLSLLYHATIVFFRVRTRSFPQQK